MSEEPTHVLAQESQLHANAFVKSNAISINANLEADYNFIASNKIK
jgi:hypothetical protein